MSLPTVAFYSIYEVSFHLRCSAADVAGWAASGQLMTMVGVEPVNCGDDLHGGLVEVAMAELMSLFRRFGPSDETCRLRRILPAGGSGWLRVTDPAAGIVVLSSGASPVDEFAINQSCTSAINAACDAGKPCSFSRLNSQTVISSQS